MDKIKVIIADDSGVMRLLIQNIISEDSEIMVLDTAVNGEEAYQKVKSLKPDILLLDLVMESYDGLYAVRQIMRKCPLPIIILSALGNSEPKKVFEALDAGAYDFVNKPDGAFNSKIRGVKKQLIHKIKLASESSVDLLKKKLNHNKNNFAHTFPKKLPYSIIVIGASTGGTTAIESILRYIPQNIPIPILIAQHIPKDFGFSFAKRLEENIGFQVRVAQNNELIKGGTIYIAPSHTNLQIYKDIISQKIYARYITDKFEAYNYPSIDALMLSVAEVYQSQAIGIILTGMGKDGTKGMQTIFQKGGFTIAQDEVSSIVFGMPKSAINQGIIKSILPLKEISHYVVGLLG